MNGRDAATKRRARKESAMANYGSDAIISKADLFKVDPRLIKVQKNWNQREDYGDLDILKRSIIENGVLNPIHVRRDGDDLVLIDGERRIRACLLAIKEGHDIESVPARMQRAGISEVEQMFVQLLANDGKPFSPVEEGRAYAKLVGWGLKATDIEKRIGRCQNYVKSRLAMVDACPDLQSAVEDGEVSIGKAVSIVKKSNGDIAKQKDAVQEERKKKETPKEKRTPPPCEMASVFQEVKTQANRLGNPPVDEPEAEYLKRQLKEAEDIIEAMRCFVDTVQAKIEKAPKSK